MSEFRVTGSMVRGQISLIGVCSNKLAREFSIALDGVLILGHGLVFGWFILQEITFNFSRQAQVTKSHLKTSSIHWYLAESFYSGPERRARTHSLEVLNPPRCVQSIINQSFYLVMQVYRVAAIRLMWTYNELIKCKTKITYKITLWYLNIQYKSLK